MNLGFVSGIAVFLAIGVFSYALGQTDFRTAAELINHTIRANHYNPAELENDTYRQIEEEVIALGGMAASADDFMPLSTYLGEWSVFPCGAPGCRRISGGTLCAARHPDRWR